MSSLYAILTADLVPSKILASRLAELLADPDGGASRVLADVISDAEAEFNSHLCGMFTAASSISLAKVQVLAVVLYRLHAGRQSNADYQIPSSVIDNWKAAISWAKGTGASLLAAEGTATAQPGAGGVRFSAPEPSHTMEQLDTL